LRAAGFAAASADAVVAALLLFDLPAAAAGVSDGVALGLAAFRTGFSALAGVVDGVSGASKRTGGVDGKVMAGGGTFTGSGCSAGTTPSTTFCASTSGLP